MSWWSKKHKPEKHVPSITFRCGKCNDETTAELRPGTNTVPCRTCGKDGAVLEIEVPLELFNAIECEDVLPITLKPGETKSLELGVVMPQEDDGEIN